MRTSSELPPVESQYPATSNVEGGGESTPPSLACHIGVLIKTAQFNLVGVIQDIRTNALSIAIKQPLMEGTPVSIEFGAECRDGEIVSCLRKGSAYDACVVIPNTNESDRRAAQRFPVTQEVRISVDSSQSLVEAVVVDLSTHGMGLETSAPLQIKEIVTVESDSSEAFGIVRHCRALPQGRYHAGVEIFHIMPKEPEEGQRGPSVVDRLFSTH
jgi:hypothetical protein